MGLRKAARLQTLLETPSQQQTAFAQAKQAQRQHLLPNLMRSIGPSFPQQRDAALNRSKFTLIGAASRTGKTFGAGEHFIDRIFDDYFDLGFDAGEIEYWAVAPHYDDCRAQKLEIIRCVPDWMIDHKRQGDKRAFFDTTHGTGSLCLIGNRTIFLKSADKPESLVAFKLRGIWWTEIARSKQAGWPNVYARLSNYADSWFIADTSPLGHCWFYEQVWKPAKEGKFVGARTFEWRAIDSPYVPKQVIEDARQNLMPAFFKREFEASWDSFLGQVYDIDDSKHLQGQCPFTPEWALVAADLNTTSTHPAEFVTFYCNSSGKKPRAWVASAYKKVIGLDYDLYASDIADTVKKLKQKFQRTNLIIDPSMHNAFKEKLRNTGVVPWNAVNDILPGVRTLGSALMPDATGVPNLSFHPDALWVVDQLRALQWNVNASGVILDTVSKALDDGAADAVRYGAMEIFRERSMASQVR